MALPGETDDRELLDGLAHGDMGALGALYEAHALAVYHLLLARVGDRGAAEDLLQEVFLALLDRGRRATRIHNLRAYLSAIARHKAHHFDNHRPRLEELHAAELIAADSCPAEAVAVREAVRQLPVEQTEVVVLKIWHGLTFEEIGEALKISQNTAASRYRYALEKLRAILGEMNDEP